MHLQPVLSGKLQNDLSELAGLLRGL